MNRGCRIAILMALVAPRLVAQVPADQPKLQGWRDTLAASSDEALRGSVGALAHPGDPTERLRAGWALSVAGTRFDSVPMLLAAADQFYEVTVRRSKWLEGWYGLGMAKAALLAKGVREVRSPHQTAGAGWAWGSAKALMEALRIDPSFAPAAAELARLTPQMGEAAGAADAWGRLQQAVSLNDADPELWMVYAEAASARGSDSTAVDALRRALALPGAPVGPIDLALARDYFALGRGDLAADAYYAGAAVPGDASRAAFRADIGFIADSADLAEYDSLAPDRRPDWLREFWGRRERQSGRPAGTRLAEHERRYRYAVDHFASLQRSFVQFDFHSPYREGPREFDDRGAVYLRHGAPDLTTGYIDPDVAPNVGWLYYRPEGNLVFNFAAIEAYGWRLLDSPLQIPGSTAHMSGVLESWMGLDPRFGTLSLRFEGDSMLGASNARLRRDPIAVGWLGDRSAAWTATIQRSSQEGRAAILRAMHTDTDPLRFDRNLDPIVQVFGAGDPVADRGRLLVVISLPGRPTLPVDPLPDGSVGYPISLRITAADDAGHTTLDIDSLVRLRTQRPLLEGEHLTIVRSYAIAAGGDQHVRVIVADSARTLGAVRVVNGVPVPDLADSALTISDLIVGRLGSGVSWDPPAGTRIPLNPLNAWTQATGLELSFEVGGLATAQSFHAQISIGDITADTTRPPKSSVAFDRTAAGPRTAVSQSLGLQALKPGRYLLSVLITSGDRSVRRERRITIAAAQ